MPAANRPRRSTRTSKRIHRTPSSEKEEQDEEEEEEEEEHEFNDDIIDTDEESSQDKHVKSKSSTRLTKKMKSIKRRQPIIQQEEPSQPEQKPKEEKPTIPKRKRDSSSATTAASAAGSETLESHSPAMEEIKRKKKDESNVSSELPSIRNVEKQRPASSSLIANMAPVDTKKLQPSIKDWKSKEDYQQQQQQQRSSLIANMAPVDTKKLQPSIKDWKSKEDYQQQQQQMSRNRESRPFGSKSVVGGSVGSGSSSSGNQPPSLVTKSDVVVPSYNAQPQPSLVDPTLIPMDVAAMMQEEEEDQKKNRIINVHASHGSGTLKEIEFFNKILFDFNQVLFKVMESSKVKRRTLGLENDNDNKDQMTTVDLLNELVNDYNKPVKDKTPKNNNVIDWNGSFLPTDDEEKFDFGNMDENPPVPMLPEDFSSKSQHWPLSWWGVIPPSDELLDYHDGGSRSRRKRSSRERKRSSSRERRSRSSRERRRNSSRERSTSIRDKSDDRDRASREDRRGREKSDRDRTSKERSRRDKSDKDRASRERSSRDKNDRDRSSRERSSRDKSGRDRTSRERSSRDKSDIERTSRERSSKGENERRKRGESSSRGRDGRHVDIAHRDRQSREREFPRDRQDGRYSRDRGEFLGDKYDRDREFFDGRQARDREFFGNVQGRERDFFREGPGPHDWRRDTPPFQGDGWRNMSDRGPPPYADSHYGPTQPRDAGWEDSRMYGDRGGRGRGNGWDGPGPGRPYGGARGPSRPGQYPRR